MAVVPHRQDQFVRALAQLDPDIGGIGVAGHVGQRLLHHAVQRDVGTRSQRRVIGAELHRHLHVHAPGGVAGQPFDRGVQPQVVEHQRTQVGRNPAQCRHGAVHHLQHAGDASVPAGTGRFGTQAEQLHLHGGQALAQFVVQFAGDAAAFFLAGLDHAGRQPAQFDPVQ